MNEPAANSTKLHFRQTHKSRAVKTISHLEAKFNKKDYHHHRPHHLHHHHHQTLRHFNIKRDSDDITNELLISLYPDINNEKDLLLLND